MPVIKDGSQDDRSRKLGARTVYAAYLIEGQALVDGQIIHNTLTGRESSLLTKLKEAPMLFTPEELAYVLLNNKWGRSGERQIVFASIVDVIAGSGVIGSSNGTGTSASFYNPRGLVIDFSGNIYTVDTENNVIRLIFPTGDVMTYAGTGVAGLRDGASFEATFDSPEGIAIDPVNNNTLYVADTLNNAIRKIDMVTGIVTTIGGSPMGLVGYADSPASPTLFNNPTALAVDSSGNVYVSDTFNNKIRMIDSNGNVSTVPTPPSSYTFSNPRGITVDSSGNVYVIDSGTNSICKISMPSQVVTVIGGEGGAGAIPPWVTPTGIYVDASGNVLVTDSGNNSVYEIDLSGKITTLLDGTTNTELSSPSGITEDASGNIYICDSGNNRIVQIIRYDTSTPIPDGFSVPDAPTGLSAGAGDSIVGLFWTPPSNTGGVPIKYYTVSSTSGTVNTPDATPFISITDLINGTAYTFSVTAVNSIGTSTPVSIRVIPFTTGETGGVVYDNPDSGTGSSDSGSGSGSGSGGSGSGSGGSGSGSGSGGSGSGSGSGGSGSGSGGSSGSAGSSTTPFTLPDPPTINMTIPEDGTVYIAWDPPFPEITGDSAITGYFLQIVTNATPQIVVYSRRLLDPFFLSANVPALVNGTSYIAKVFSVNNLGYSPNPAVSTPFTPIQDISVVPANQSAQVSWTVPAISAPDVITGYVLNVTDASNNPIPNVSGSPALITGLSTTVGTRVTYKRGNLINAILYNFSIDIITTSGEVANGSSISTTPDITMPGPVLRSSIVVTPGNGSAQISWTAPLASTAPLADDSIATGYILQYTAIDRSNPIHPVTTISAPIIIPSSSINLTGLTNTTVQYTFTITATNTSAINPANRNYSTTTTTASSYYIGPPSAPTIQATTYGNKNLTVHWQSSTMPGGTPIQGYKIYYAGTSILAATVTSSDTSAQITLDQNGNTLTNGPPGYSFTVLAYNSIGNSSSSASSVIEYPDNFTPSPPPNTIAIENVAGASGTLRVSWTTPSTTADGSDAEYYLIYAYDTSTLPTPLLSSYTREQLAGVTAVQQFTTALNATSQDFTFPQSGNAIQYTFIIYSVNTSFHSGTNVSAGTSTANVPPVTPNYVTAAPTITSVTPYNLSATVAWSAPTNGVTGIPAIDNYTITYTDTTAFTPPQTFGPISNSALSTTISSLINGHTYSFSIKARNSAGNSPSSNLVTAVPDVTPPGVPTAQVATADNYSATLGWTTPQGNADGSPIDGYEINLYDSTNSLITNAITTYKGVNFIQFPYSAAAASATTFTAYGLTNIQYYWTIQAFTNSVVVGKKYSAVVNTQSQLVRPNIAPLAPIFLSSISFNTYATINWTPPTDAPANGIPNKTGYYISANSGATFGVDGSTPASTYTITDPLASSVKITGLINGNSYTFYIRAINSASADGVPSALPYMTVSSVIPDFTTPGPVTSLTVTPGNGGVQLSWTAPTLASAPAGDLSPAHAYLISYTGTDGSNTSIVTNNNTTYTIASLTNTTVTYTFSVTAQNTRVYQPLPPAYVTNSSTIVTAAATAIGPPSAPVYKLVPGNGKITVRWLPSTQPGGKPIDGYRIYEKNADGSFSLLNTILASASQPYNVIKTPLTNGQVYNMAVVAYNSITNIPGVSYSSPAGTQQLVNESLWQANFAAATPKSPASPDAVDNSTPIVPTTIYTDSNPTVQLTWTPPADDGGSVITKYLIRYYKESVEGSGTYDTVNTPDTGDIFVPTTQTSPPNQTPVTYNLVTGTNGVALTYNTKYKFTVTAINAATNYVSNRSSFIINGIDTYDPINEYQESDQYPFTPATGIPPKHTRWPDAPVLNTPSIQYYSNQGTNTATVSWTVPPIYGKLITEYNIQIFNALTNSSVLGGIINGIPQPDYISVTDSSIISLNPGDTATYTPTLYDLRSSPIGLINGTPYYVKVAAVNNGYDGQITYSSQSSPITLFSMPGAPTLGTVTPINLGVTITWTAPASQAAGGGISSYKIYVYSQNGQAFQRVATSGTFLANPVLVNGVIDPVRGNITTPAPTSTTITGLDNATTYYFTVVSSNPSGDSTNSNTVDSTITASSPSFTPDYTAPAPVTTLTSAAASAGYSATISWTTPSPNVDGSPINGYILALYYYSEQTGGWQPAEFVKAYPLYILVNTATGSVSSITDSATPIANTYDYNLVTKTGSSYSFTCENLNYPDVLGRGLAYGIIPYNISRIDSNNLIVPTEAHTSTWTTLANSISAANPFTNLAGTYGTFVLRAPIAPPSYSITSTSNTLSLSWSVITGAVGGFPNNGGTAIQGYKIYNMGVSNSVPAYTIANPATISYQITGLTNGQEYTYKISAYNSAGESVLLSPTILPPTQISSAPTAIWSDPTAKTLPTITWISPIVTNGSPITGYIIYTYKYNPATLTSTTSSFNITTSEVITTPQIDTSQTTSYTFITGLENGYQYKFTVVATNGYTPLSAQSPLSSYLTSPPAQVAAPSVGVVANALVPLSWTEPLNGGAAISSYTVKAYSGGSILSSTTSNNALLFTGLTNGTEYTFTVIATNSVGDSVESSGTLGTPDYTAPVNLPSIVSAVAGSSAATLTWNVPSLNADGSDIDGYEITLVDSITGAIIIGATDTYPIYITPKTTTTYTATGLTPQSSYKFQIKAYVTSTISPYSKLMVSSFTTSSAVTAYGLPGTPSISGSITRGDSTITFSFTAASANGSPITSYVLTQSDPSPPENFTTTPATLVPGSVRISGLLNDITYTFSLVARNAAGDSAIPLSIQGTPQAVIAAAPSQITSTPTAVWSDAAKTLPTVTWDATQIDINGSPITGYNIYTYKYDTATPPVQIGVSSFISIDGTSETTSYTLTTALENGFQYRFTVIAKNGFTPLSAESPFTLYLSSPPSKPGTPTITITPAPSALGTGSVDLTWTASSYIGISGATLTYTVKAYSGGSYVSSQPLSPTPNTSLTYTTGFTFGLSYTFKVVATNSVGDSVESDGVIARPSAQVSISNVELANTYVKIDWLIPADGVNTPTSSIRAYRIYACNSAGTALGAAGPPDVIIDSSTPEGVSILGYAVGATATYAFPSLINYTVYTFRIIAINNISLISTPSNFSSAVTPEFPKTLTRDSVFDGYVVKYNISGIPMWSRRIGEIGGKSITIYNSIIDSSGNLYVSGTYQTTARFYDYTGTNIKFSFANAAASTTSAFVAKYSIYGEPLWAGYITNLGASSQANVIKTDTANNVYISGNFISSTITIGTSVSGVSTYTLTKSAVAAALHGNFFVVRYTKDGTPNWFRSIGGDYTTNLSSIDIQSNGNLFITGTTMATTFYIYNELNTSLGNYTTKSPSSADGVYNANDVSFLIRLNTSNSSNIKVSRLGHKDVDEYYEITTESSDIDSYNGYAYFLIDGAGSQTVTGSFYDSTHTSNNRFTAELAGDNGYLVIYDSRYLEASAVSNVGSYGNTYLAYVIKHSTGCCVFRSSGGGKCMFYRANGTLVWTGTVTNAAEVRGYVDSYTQDIYMCGDTSSSLSLSANSTANAESKTTLSANGYLVKYDKTGNCKWIVGLSCTDVTVANTSITTDSVGNVYFSVNCSGTLIVYNSDQTSAGTVTLSGNNDTLIIKYDSSGNVVWCNRSYSADSTGNENASNCLLDATNTNIYVTGTYSKTLSLTGPTQNSKIHVPFAAPAVMTAPTVAWADPVLKTNMTLTWTIPAQNGNSIIGYNIYIYNPSNLLASPNIPIGITNPMVIPATPSTSSYTFTTALLNGYGYAFKMLALNGFTPIAAQGAMSATFNTVPSQPVAPTVGARANTTVSLSWVAPTLTGGTAITSYTVKAYSNGDYVSEKQPSPLTGTSLTFNGLTNGTLYTFTVRATNSVGNSVESPQSSETTPVIPTAPSAISEVSAEFAGLTSSTVGQAVITWIIPSNGGPVMTNYIITVYDNSGNAVSPTSTTVTTASILAAIEGTTVKHTFTSLPKNKSYKFKIKATNNIGSSSLSGFTNLITLPNASSAPTVTSTVRNSVSLTKTSSGSTTFRASVTMTALQGIQEYGNYASLTYTLRFFNAANTLVNTAPVVTVNLTDGTSQISLGNTYNFSNSGSFSYTITITGSSSVTIPSSGKIDVV
jgi:sugar lactone lactonase YvrE